MKMESIDLLRPETAMNNYRNQIKHTIDAYSVPHIVVGEALQNALDAVAIATTQKKILKGEISIEINFDSNTVIVKDNGIGFPNESGLLILGGTEKPKSSKTVAGMVGVGIKVVLYCTEFFSIKAKTDTECWTVEISGANRFKDDQSLQLNIPVPFSIDTSPLEKTGTNITYKFPGGENGMMNLFMEAVRNRIVETEVDADSGFPSIVKKSADSNQVVYLLASFLQRFSYVGDTLEPIGGRIGLNNTTIKVSLTSKNHGKDLGEFWSKRWGNEDTVEIEIKPQYLGVEQTIKLTKVQRPTIFKDNIGHGGTGLSRTSSGFNVTNYTTPQEYKNLLSNSRGEFPSKDILDRFERRLFPKINCIKLTIGRIPQLSQYLPNGSRRVLSANGVVTEHDLEITSGRNQQYVRCVDLVIDLDAELNYGKTQLTNGPLVGLVREFVNESYKRTIQYAAANFVGKIVEQTDDEPGDVFWARSDMSPRILDELCKQPRDENDVIALFVALVTSKKLYGYVIYGFSQSDKYDSRMVVLRECDRSDLLKNHTENDLRTVEFKLAVSSIIRDFNSENKDIKDIHLLVAWEKGELKDTRFSLEVIEYSTAFQYSPKKVFSGATHYLNDNRSGKQLQVLLLKDYIDKYHDKA